MAKGVEWFCVGMGVTSYSSRYSFVAFIPTPFLSFQLGPVPISRAQHEKSRKAATRHSGRPGPLLVMIERNMRERKPATSNNDDMDGRLTLASASGETDRPPTMRRLSVAVGTYIGAAAVLFSWLEGWSFLDALYFSVGECSIACERFSAVVVLALDAWSIRL